MFDSLPRLELQAKQLLLSYVHFVDKSAGPTISARGSDTPFVGDVQGIAVELADYGRSAREIQADPDWPTLPEKLQADTIALAEEAEIGAAEIRDLCDPDAVWEKTERSVKQNATNRLRHRREDVDLIRARLKHEIRKQNGGQAVRVVPERPKVDSPVVDVTPPKKNSLTS